MAWFPKEVDLTWIHISFVYANIYLSFYFEGPHSNFRYILVALKKDGNNVHFFDVLPHCAPVCASSRSRGRSRWLAEDPGIIVFARRIPFETFPRKDGFRFFDLFATDNSPLVYLFLGLFF